MLNSTALHRLPVCGVCAGSRSSRLPGVAALVLLARVPGLPQDLEVRKAKDTRRVNVAGVIFGVVAAALSTYVAPLVLTVLTEGSLESLDLTIYFLTAAAYTPLCIPMIAVVSIPLAIGCGHVGLEIGRAIGRPDSRFLVWCGAFVGGVVGVVLGSLAAFAVGHTGV